MLNSEQQQVVDSDAKKLLVLAGAGTGKTTVLLARVSRLVSDGVNPTSILGLTFTNAAASEMRTRYLKIHKDQITPTFCTFHSFCYSLIIRDKGVRNAIGYFYRDPPEIADESVLRNIETTVRQQCGTKISATLLHTPNNVLSPKEKFQYDVFWKRFSQKLRKDNLITFDTMCYDVCKLFVEDHPAIQIYKHQYTHIFVDEFQDTNQPQWDFVKSFTESNMLCVGDAKQSIYAFRGSTSAIIKELAESDDWTTIKLDHNYRSTKQICDYANKIHDVWGNSPYNLAIHSDSTGCDVITKHDTSDEGILSESMLKEIVESGPDTCKIAILCRTNAEVANVKKSLQYNFVTYAAKADTKVSTTEHLLRSSLDPMYMINWLSNKLTSDEYNLYIKKCALDHAYQTSANAFAMEYQNRFKSELSAISSIRKVLKTECFPEGKLVTICNMLHIHTPEQAVIQDNSIQGIIDTCITYEHKDTTKHDSNIYVGTIHSVKGLEYDVVHLIGVNGRYFPLNKEDQKNLFYVGCTRAKNLLYVWKCI